MATRSLSASIVIMAVAMSAVGGAPPPCCSSKTVGGVEYILKKEEDTSTYNCVSNCVFEKVEDPGRMFCFAAGDLEVTTSCDDPPGDKKRCLPAVLCESVDLITGYLPRTDVLEHLRLDLDQRDFEDFLNSGDFSAATDIYVNGGNSMKTMTITLEPLSQGFSQGSIVDQGNARGILIKDASEGATSLKISVTSNCFGEFSKTKDTSGCFSDSGPLNIAGVEVASQITVNLPYRTLAGFSVEAEKKMTGQEMFEIYKAYYGAGDYADKFIKAALNGEDETQGVNVSMNFVEKETIFRKECAKKGSAYWSNWMYTIREMEDAIDDCKSDCEFCNDAKVYAWDEAVAFYSGSLEGETGNQAGKMLYRLAEKRCKNFKTCIGEMSKVNKEIIIQFEEGKEKLNQGKCVEIRPIMKKIINLMSIPLIQGTLRYAYKIARGDGTPKDKAEGIAFLGAILPRLHSCSQQDADTVRQHMWIDGDMNVSEDGFKTVKEAFERNYACMGVGCTDIGGHLDDQTDDYLTDFGPCTDNDE